MHSFMKNDDVEVAAICDVYEPYLTRDRNQVDKQLLEALGHVHEKGIAHRDIKPANVLLAPPGRVVLVDFGLALDPSMERLSAAGVRLGTFAYMPPEWIAGESDSPPSSWDVYGAGQLLWELLTGERAFDPKASLGQLMRTKMSQEFLDPGTQVPAPARELVRALTAADPAVRPPDGRAAHGLWAHAWSALGLED